MDIFSHMRVNGIYWWPFWEDYNLWGKETITFGWPLNTLSNKKKSGNCWHLLFFWQCQDFESAIHPLFPIRHSSFLSWIRLKQMISLKSSPWGFFSGTAVGIHSRVETLAERKCCATSSHKSNRLNNSATTTRKWDGKWVFDFLLWLQRRPYEKKLLFFWIVCVLI